MKKKIGRQIVSLILILAMLVVLTPENLSLVRAAETTWAHMSDAEKNLGKASYNSSNNTLTFSYDTGWSSRMNYTGISDVSGKDYAVEFDVTNVSGLFGVYNMDDTGSIYGVYLDTGSLQLDAVQHDASKGQTVDFLAFVEPSLGMTQHPTVPASNWTAADKASAHVRVEYIRGESGTLAGGTVNYYKKDSTTGEYLKMGSVSIPADVHDPENRANHFGIQFWYGAGTVSNVTFSEMPQVTVGGGNTHTAPVQISVSYGDELPVNTYVSGKYILGWTVDGQEVTHYDQTIATDRYVAEFIDTKMLAVKCQEGKTVFDDTEEDPKSVRMNMRFVASVDNLSYKTTGFVFSLTEKTPEMGKAACVSKSTTTVYKALLADGELKNVSEVYPGGYSTYMYANRISRIPAGGDGTTIYVRAYIELPDGGTYVYGDTRAVNVRYSAGTTMSDASGDYSLEFIYNETVKNYNTSIKKTGGTPVVEQVNPIILRIKTGTSSQEMIAANYSRVSVMEDGLEATAEIKSTNGSTFAVTDKYLRNDTGGFILNRDIKVITVGAGDVGFNSVVEFKEKEASTYDRYEYFMPGLVIRDSTYLIPGAIGYDLSQSFILARDSQMGLPMAMMKRKGSNIAFSMGRVIHDKVTTNVDESSSDWIVDASLQYGSTGFANTRGFTSMVLWYPGVGTNSTGSVERSHPIQTDVVHSYEVLLLPMEEESFTDAMVTSYKTQFGVNEIPETDSDLAKVYSGTLGLFDAYTTKTNGKYGMPFSISLDGKAGNADYYMGFIGQQPSVGYHFIRAGIRENNAGYKTKGEAIIELWVSDGSFTSYGFPYTSYNASNRKWKGDAHNTSVCFLRSMSDGMEGILDAYLIEKQYNTEKTAWLNKCIAYADWLVSVQNADGSFYRAYSCSTGKASDEGKYTTSCNIRYLVRMYEQTQKAEYLNAAKKAGEYVYKANYLSDTYHGGIADGNGKLDKESAVMAMYGFDSLYQATGEYKWLEAAEHAAICTAAFIYTFDFSVVGKGTKTGLDEKYNIYNDKGTAGLSRISIENWGSDLFSAYLYYEYFKLYVYTQDPFYYDFAKLLQDNTKRFINIDNSIPVYAKNGLANEAFAIANMFYEDDVMAYLPWCGIAMIDPIGTMESAFGVKSIEEAKALGQDTLVDKLGAYGAGGRFRQ